MNNLEKVEKLREKSNISYEEAKNVLEECDWDLLDAVIKLEEDGKINAESGKTYSTKTSDPSETPKNPQEVVESYQNYENSKSENEKGFFNTLWDAVKFLVKKGCENKFVVKRYGNSVLDIPVILLIALMIPFFWAIIIFVILGLFFNFSYNFAGPDLGKKNVNDVMEKATKMAEDLKTEAKNDIEKSRKKDVDNAACRKESDETPAENISKKHNEDNDE